MACKGEIVTEEDFLFVEHEPSINKTSNDHLDRREKQPEPTIEILQCEIHKLQEEKRETQKWFKDILNGLQQKITGQSKEIDESKNVKPPVKGPAVQTVHSAFCNVNMEKIKSHDDFTVSDILNVIEFNLIQKEKKLIETTAELKQNNGNLAKMKADLKKSEEQLNNTKADLKLSNDKLKKTEAELDVTRTRLSKAMGAKLTDNNPSITDLSDQNRPTKLAEKYQELYDNQWTDAYEIIETKYKNEREVNRNVETNAISMLIKILMETKEFCEDGAASQTNVVQKAITLGRVPKGTDKCICVPQTVVKEIKDFRRKVAAFSGKEIYKIYQNRLSQSTSSTAEVARIVPEFVEKCFEICWLMTVQDPPLAFGPNIKRGDRFDTNMYKTYIKSGRKFDFVVWPTLLLHQNGPVLSKGIAQGLVEDGAH